MEQIVELVKQRAGIGEEQARTAVDVVLGEVKKGLPEPIAGQIDGLLDGGAGQQGNPLGGLGGMLGR